MQGVKTKIRNENPKSNVDKVRKEAMEKVVKLNSKDRPGWSSNGMQFDIIYQSTSVTKQYQALAMHELNRRESDS